MPTTSTTTTTDRPGLVQCATHGSVATLTVCRSEKGNALNGAVVWHLHQQIQRLANDATVTGIILRGADGAFISGIDVGFFVRNLDAGDVDRLIAFTRSGHALLAAISDCPKRVVAAVEGAALGAGLELAMACDRIIASPRSTLGLPECSLGIYPGMGGTQRTPRRIGIGLAKWMIYTGTRVPATTAAQIGLVDEVVAPDALQAAAHQWVVRGVKRDQQRFVKRSLRVGCDERGGAATVPSANDFASRTAFFSQHRVKQIRLGNADTFGDPHLIRAMHRIGKQSPISLGLAESLIEASRALPLAEGLALEIEHLPEIFATKEAREGLAAAIQKLPSR